MAGHYRDTEGQPVWLQHEAGSGEAAVGSEEACLRRADGETLQPISMPPQNTSGSEEARFSKEAYSWMSSVGLLVLYV